MNRRAFFSVLAGVAATAVLDPEKLLWVPGKKLISIPNTVSDAQMEAFAERYLSPAAAVIADQIDNGVVNFYDVMSGNAMYRFRMYDGKGHLQAIWRPSPVAPLRVSSFPWASDTDQSAARSAGE